MTFPRKPHFLDGDDALRTRREQTTLDHGFASFIVPRQLTRPDLDRLERWLGEILNDLTLRVASDVTPDVPPDSPSEDAPRFQQPDAHVPLASQPKPAIPRR